MNSDLDDLQLQNALSARFSCALPASARAAELHGQLLDRVRRSADSHREYITIRVEDGAWRPVSTGAARRVLRSDAHVRVEIQRLAAGAVLPWPDDAHAQELLLLSGQLSSATGASSPTGLPGAAGYCTRRRGDNEGPLVAGTDCLLYVRHLLVDAAELPPVEAQWWQMATATAAWVDPARKRWRASSEGVDVLPLRGNADVVSMLVRFEAGAAVPDHFHALDEDCLVLQGEMFLGDILLRTGDYQLAPAGGTHFGECSDVGVLFFFHGALDPALRGQAGAAPHSTSP